MKKMKFLKNKTIYAFLLLLVFFFGSSTTVDAKTSVKGAPAFTLTAHQSMVGDIGPERNVIGNENDYWLEGITLSLNAYSSDFTYKVMLAGDGKFSKAYKNGEFAGTTGQSRALTGFLLETKGKLAKSYDVYYRCWLNYLGVTKWEKANSTPIGSSIEDFHIRKIELCVVPKGEKAPKDASDYPGYVVISPYEVSTWSAQQGSVLRLSQISGGLVSHATLNAVDSTWMSTFHSPYTAVIADTTYSYGRIVIRNANGAVHTPSGLKNNITISTLHSSNYSEYKVGDIVGRNQKLLNVAGTDGTGNTEFYQYHTEIRCSDTYVATSDFSKHSVWGTYAFDIFFVDPLVTNVIEEGIAKSGTAPGYLSSYRGRWSYRDHRLPYGAESYYATANVINKCPLRDGPAQCYNTKRVVNSGTVNIIGKVSNGYGNTFYVLESGEWAYAGNLKITEEKNVVVTNVSSPTGNLRYGNVFIIKGTITNLTTSPKKLTVRCLDSAGQQCFTYTDTINSRIELQGSAWDNHATFNALKRGKYVYQVLVEGKVVVESNFNII